MLPFRTSAVPRLRCVSKKSTRPLTSPRPFGVYVKTEELFDETAIHLTFETLPRQLSIEAPGTTLEK